MSVINRAPTAADEAVGANIRLFRIASGLSQQVLAEKLGITFQQIQKYERGRNRVSAGRLVEIARALDVPLMNFFIGASEEFEPREAGTGHATLQALGGDPALIEALSRLTKASPGIRRAVIAMIDASAPRPTGRPAQTDPAEGGQGRPAAAHFCATEAADAAEDRETEAA